MMNQAVAYDMHDRLETMDPVQLTIMAYDGIIKDLRLAKKYLIEHVEDNVIEKNQHAQDIITELLLGLDYEQGGEIARNLSKLYDFALRQLVSIGRESDVLIYEHLINIFSDLRGAWAQISMQNS